jgi:hypothetical protein
LLDYGAIPTEKWGIIDFSIGAFIGAYFPLRDHLNHDCYSSLLHTSLLLIDANRAFIWVPNESTSDIIFAWNLDPLFAGTTLFSAMNNCMLTNTFFADYSSIVDQYFPDWGFGKIQSNSTETTTEPITLADESTLTPTELLRQANDYRRIRQSDDSTEPEPESTESTDPSEPVSEPIVQNPYGEALDFFLQAELEAAYSETTAYIDMGLSFLQFSWAAWKIWTSFTSRYYFYELGNYTGRMLAHLFAAFHWLVDFDSVLA